MSQIGKQLYSVTAKIHGQVLKVATVLLFEDDEPYIETNFIFYWAFLETAKCGGTFEAEKIWNNKAGKEL